MAYNVQTENLSVMIVATNIKIGKMPYYTIVAHERQLNKT